MKALLAMCSTVLLALACPAAEKAPTALPRSRPEAQGISPAALLAFVDEADRKIDSLHSFLLVRHGHVVAECWWAPYDAQTRHELYSLSKSFTSTAVGLAIAEGKRSLDDPVLKFFPEDAPEQASANLKAMRVHDLLRMSTGHQTEPPRRDEGKSSKLSLSGAHADAIIIPGPTVLMYPKEDER